MAKIYNYRLKCITENKNVYWLLKDNQPEPTKCPNDTSHEVDLSTLVIEETFDENIFTQVLGEGIDKRLRWKGYQFDASGNTTTNYDFSFDTDIFIQGGYFSAHEANTGDIIEFILAPEIPGAEYKYVETLYLTKNAEYSIVNDYDTSAVPAGIPVRVAYTNTTDVVKKINFALLLRLSA
jgi:hypothetical protein